MLSFCFIVCVCGLQLQLCIYYLYISALAALVMLYSAVKVAGYLMSVA